MNEALARSILDDGAESISYPSLREATRTWVRVALLSFGGPAGQIAVMHRIIVEEKRWVSEERFLHALNYCMLLPGPEAQQLATYIGWLMHRTLGGLWPVVCLSCQASSASWCSAMFTRSGAECPSSQLCSSDLKAAVLAIVIEAVIRIGRRALKSRSLVLLAVASFVGIFFFAVPFPLIILAAALLGLTGVVRTIPLTHRSIESASGQMQQSLLGDEAPEHANATIGRTTRVAACWLVLWLTPVIALLMMFGAQNVFSQIAVFFSKMAMVTFGGAYAVLAYVAQQAVQHYGWLTPPEMLDGLGMAETTPGPLIMVLQFVGFMAAFRNPGTLSPLFAGTLGGLLATWVTFTPCFLWIFVGAPFIERLRNVTGLNAALSAVTAAVVGVILNLAIWFAIHTIFGATVQVRTWPLAFDAPVLSSLDSWALGLTLAAAFAIFRLNWGMIPTLASSCGAGVALHLLGVI